MPQLPFQISQPADECSNRIPSRHTIASTLKAFVDGATRTQGVLALDGDASLTVAPLSAKAARIVSCERSNALVLMVISSSWTPGKRSTARTRRERCHQLKTINFERGETSLVDRIVLTLVVHCHIASPQPLDMFDRLAD